MKASKYIGLTLFILVIVIVGFAISERITPIGMVDKTSLNQGLFSEVVINGYDPVSYHTDHKAVAGVEEIHSEWKGGKWLFSTLENKTLFDASPVKYAPLFGGYCVYAITQGFTANTNPEIFEVVNGNLVLFAAEDVRNEWMKDPVGNIEACTQYWNE